MAQSQPIHQPTLAPQPTTILDVTERLMACHEPENNHPDEVAQSPARSTDRRSLLRGLGLAAIATAATMTAPAPVDARGEYQEATLPPMMRRPGKAALGAAAVAQPPLPSLAIIALNRIGFGPRPGDIQAFNALGSTPEARLTAYVDQQLNPATIDDSDCDARIAAAGFQTLTLPLEQLWLKYIQRAGDENKNNDGALPAKEIERLTFLRARYSKRQLAEVLADYWHNHFNIYGWQWPIYGVWVHYDRDVIRKHMLGNFRAFLEAVAQSPAMLYYLDNDANSGGDPNENYARELFELHGMGAENYLGVRDPNDPDLVDENGERLGYIDADVYGATTAFTGWQIDWDTGKYTFNDADHFPFQKVILGRILPGFQGEKDGKDVLDMIANHPGTARYVCRRLCRRLLSDNPPEAVVQAAAGVFYANRSAPDQLKKVVRTILLAPEFSTTWGEKAKRPFEFTVSAMRALNLDFAPQDPFFWNYDPIGQGLFEWRTPDGYPDDAKDWTTTMPFLQCWRMVNWLVEWKYGGDGANKDEYRAKTNAIMPPTITLPYEVIDYWSHRMLGMTLPESERTAAALFLADGRNLSFALPADLIEARLRSTVALILMSPSFRWR